MKGSAHRTRTTDNRLNGAWFGRGVRKEPALKREAVVEEAFLAFLPFVRARCDVIGWVLGVKLKRRKRGNRWEQVEEPVEREVEREADLTAPAAEVAELGVQRVSLSGDRLLPLDEGALRKRGMLFRPSRTEAEVAATLTSRALAEAERSAVPDRVTFSWLKSIRQRVALVYYPLWVLRYGFRGRTYQALVDAEDGSLAFGKAPGNHVYRAGVLVGTCGAACFLATTALQHVGWWLKDDGGLAIAAGLGLAVFGLIRWGYAQFRRGGVVEEGTGLAAERVPESLQGGSSACSRSWSERAADSSRLCLLRVRHAR